ncbi:MAG: substrate-binding domain-containing protein [Planctomycetaceae bacterium]|jgi:DNA-binding LacI/PurR family transcriptional regulator|nr:substrate-binding domain-containing protein [Planctomycetaceae bacterium]
MKNRDEQNDKRPLHRSIFEYVQNLILSGECHHKQKLPTDHQLMRRFNVSRATVAKAMRDLENQGIIERRPGVGSFIKPLAASQSVLLAVVIAGLGDTEFYEPICASIAQSCYKRNYGLLWGASAGIHSREMTLPSCNDYAHRLLAQRVSGIFYAPDEIPENWNGDDPNEMFLDAIHRAGIKIVLLDRDYVPFTKKGLYDVVGIDNFQAGFDQTHHLIRCECKRIFYVARPGITSTKSARIAGYRYALSQAGQSASEDRICVGDVYDSVFVDKILKHKPDGIVCFHDPIAAALIQALLLKKIRVPEEIKIIGLDDVKYSQLIQVPLSTIHQPCREIGAQALNLMEERINNSPLPPRHVHLPTQLIVRNSTGSDANNVKEVS